MTIADIPIWVVLTAILLLFSQSVILFLHARHHNHKFYWLWGLFGIIQFPSPTILYILFAVKPWRKKH
ncbi:sigma-Y antisigma factor component [Paenibacillus albiflavus]|uniref:Sigma-Y antisigma factor component n=1 Tax=Paenibacillus albiflavus TaxID=2545760 RepID=A0A4R4EKG0_9BACL|nr:sigma-Y antisigma factor component [Paenibacillus albiflavus]